MLSTLFIHCTLGHGGMWRGVLAGLPGVQAVTMDLPGHGRGPVRDPGLDFHDQSTALALSHLPAGPCAVVGHSFGATVALRLALENPSRIKALVLIEPVLFHIARDCTPAAYAANMADFEGSYQAAQRGDWAEATRRFTTTWGAGVPWDDLPDHARKAATQRMSLVFDTGPAVNDDTPGLTAPGRLEQLTIPVLLIEGDQSPSVIAGVQGELARRLPQATRIVIAAAGHMAPVTHPAAVAQAIADWGGLAA